MIRIFVFFVLCLLCASQAHAYIGPGAGVGFLGSLWAWLVGVVVVVLAILIWPLRWFLRRLRAKGRTRSDAADSSSTQ
jgi:hypothetical protein